MPLDLPKSRLNHDDAERVGKRLCARWQSITGKNAPVLNDLVWADIVQFVERHTSKLVTRRDADREGEGER